MRSTLKGKNLLLDARNKTGKVASPKVHPFTLTSILFRVI